jgi:hypothetical protein
MEKILLEASAPLREQLGFRRTVCGCAFCQAPCRHIPGALDVADLPRLCPADQDVFAWAERHLRALVDRPAPTLIPARQANGHCHWHYEGKCAVHESAPYGCAFFDTHMNESEVERRWTATVQARQEDAANDGLYYRVWRHLCRKGLIDGAGTQTALAEDFQRIQRTAVRSQRRRRRT